MKNAKAKQIIVTGGTGFVGSYLISLLTKKGYKVTLLSRRHSPPLPGYHSQAKKSIQKDS